MIYKNSHSMKRSLIVPISNACAENRGTATIGDSARIGETDFLARDWSAGVARRRAI